MITRCATRRCPPPTLPLPPGGCHEPKASPPLAGAFAYPFALAPTAGGGGDGCGGRLRKDTSKSNEFCQYSLNFGFAPRNPSIFGIVRLSNRLSSTVVRQSFDDLRRTTVKWFDGFFDGAPILFTFLHCDATPGHRSVPFGVRSSNFAKRQSNGSKIVEIWRTYAELLPNFDEQTDCIKITSNRLIGGESASN